MPNGAKTAQVFTFVTLNNASCPADKVLQSKTGGLATCVPRDNDYVCADGQTLEKIVDGKPVCVAKDGTYTCASDQVLKEIKNGAAVCVNRDRDFNCGDYQLLQKRVNNQEFCGDPRTHYVCPYGQVLQATYTFDAVCVDNHNGGLSCPGGTVVTGVINGMPQCGGIPAQPLPNLGGVTTKHKDPFWQWPDAQTYVCPDGHYVVGYDCGGKCNSNNMKVRCAQIQLVNP
jgi:hypothetical protein